MTLRLRGANDRVVGSVHTMAIHVRCNDAKSMCLAENTDSCEDGNEHLDSKRALLRNRQFMRLGFAPWRYLGEN